MLLLAWLNLLSARVQRFFARAESADELLAEYRSIDSLAEQLARKIAERDRVQQEVEALRLVVALLEEEAFSNS